MRFSTILAFLPLALSAPSIKREEPAPLLEARGQAISGKYIVKLRDGSPLASLQKALSMLGGDADHVFENLFSGFAGSMNSAVVKLVRMHPDVSLPLSAPLPRAITIFITTNTAKCIGRVHRARRRHRHQGAHYADRCSLGLGPHLAPPEGLYRLRLRHDGRTRHVRVRD